MNAALKRAAKRLVFGSGPRWRRYIGGPLKGTVGYLDLERDTQQWRGIYEIALQEWIARAIQPGDTCLDVGAAEGYFAVLMAKYTGVDGTVIGFEPSERGDFVKETFTRNPDQALGRLILVPEFVVGPHTTGLSGVKVDDYMVENNVARVDVVKIDIDGGEVDALEGMRATLERFHPHLAVEVHSPELCEGVRAIAAELGYEMDLVDPPAYEYRPIPYNKFLFSRLPS